MKETRRDFLAHIIAAAGLSSAPLPAAVCEVLRESASRAHFKVLSPVQAQFLEHTADIVIPATDTAAASDAGVVRFIDGMLADWYSAEESTAYLQGLELYRSAAGPLPSADSLAKLDEAAFLPENTDNPPMRFYRTTKELVMIGYFTSREGMRHLDTHGPTGHFSFEPSGPPGHGIRY